MSEHTQPHESLHLTVVRESSKNYQSYLRKRTDLAENDSLLSKIRKLTQERLSMKHKQSRDTAGFN
jgi:hypothetical protein